MLLCFTASIEIPYQDRLHTQFIQWMSTNDSLRRSRDRIAREKDAITFPWQYEDDTADEDEDLVADQGNFESDREAFWRSQRRCRKPIRCTPSRKKFHLFLYQGCILAVYHNPDENHNNVWFTNAEIIRVYSFFWSKEVLVNLL